MTPRAGGLITAGMARTLPGAHLAAWRRSCQPGEPRWKMVTVEQINAAREEARAVAVHVFHLACGLSLSGLAEAMGMPSYWRERAAADLDTWRSEIVPRLSKRLDQDTLDAIGMARGGAVVTVGDATARSFHHMAHAMARRAVGLLELIVEAPDLDSAVSLSHRVAALAAIDPEAFNAELDREAEAAITRVPATPVHDSKWFRRVCGAALGENALKDAVRNGHLKPVGNSRPSRFKVADVINWRPELRGPIERAGEPASIVD